MSDLRLERALSLIAGEWGGDRESALAWLDRDEYWTHASALNDDEAKLCLTEDQQRERERWNAYIDGIRAPSQSGSSL